MEDVHRRCGKGVEVSGLKPDVRRRALARQGERRDLYAGHAAVNRLLLIHPDDALVARASSLAERAGMTVVHARDPRAAQRILSSTGAFSIILLGGAHGVGGEGDLSTTAPADTVRQLQPLAGQAHFIVIADGHLSMETCCDVVRLGIAGIVDARDGVLDEEALTHRIQQARKHYGEAASASDDIHSLKAVCGDSFVWQSKAMADVLAKAARAAQVSDVPVLIFGESGTGKQLLAELIHQLDPKRSHKRFLSVNCSAISGTLAESALFGHVKGAFTGAVGSRKGLFRAADGGTVLLDEIGEMDAVLQPKLLRVLQEGVVMPLGSDDETDIDVRVVAATNRQLAACVEEGQFRLDLYQRLNVIALEIPPLRERPEDIPILVRFFLKRYADYYERPIEAVEPAVYEHLAQSMLAGNVRELENLIRQMLAFKSSGSVLTMDDVRPSIMPATGPADRDQSFVLSDMVKAACRLVEAGEMTLPELVSACEKHVLRSSLERSQATSSELARHLGLSRRTLYNKIRKYHLPAPGRTGTS
jgi:transcriptional regulator with PAS, ATPase and Fis domain